MALYVRHHAWLNAAPKPRKGDDKPSRSRRESLEAEGLDPDMPFLEWGGYLVQYLFEFGPTTTVGMGSVPVPPPYIESWQRQTGLTLLPWEFALLLRLSGEYAGEAAVAVEADRKPPFTESRAARWLQEIRVRDEIDNFLD